MINFEDYIAISKKYGFTVINDLVYLEKIYSSRNQICTFFSNREVRIYPIMKINYNNMEIYTKDTSKKVGTIKTFERELKKIKENYIKLKTELKLYNIDKDF